MSGHDAASNEREGPEGALGSASFLVGRWSRMVVVTAGSRITLMIRMSPPHFAQIGGSTSSTRQTSVAYLKSCGYHGHVHSVEEGACPIGPGRST